MTIISGYTIILSEMALLMALKQGRYTSRNCVIFATKFTSISCPKSLHHSHNASLKDIYRIRMGCNVRSRGNTPTLGISALTCWMFMLKPLKSKNAWSFEINTFTRKRALCEGHPYVIPLKEEEQMLISSDNRKNMLHWAVHIVCLLLRFTQLCFVFGFILFLYPLGKINDKFYKVWLKLLFHAVEFSGPAFIKLGQWGSTRRDLFSRELCDQFSHLHHYVRPHSWKFTEKALLKAYGEHWWEIIKIDRNQEPIGSGCIAQVYKGYVHNIAASEVEYAKENHLGQNDQQSDEKEVLESFARSPNCIPVAVKVLHPHVRENFGRDLSLMRVMSKILERFIPSLRWVNLEECVQEFSIAMTKQMNMVHEARCLNHFCTDFATLQFIRFPVPIMHLTHEDILVESFEEGHLLSDILDETVVTSSELKKKIADIGTDTLFHMVFLKNFVHGDLHPGNILVQNAAEYNKASKPDLSVADIFDVTSDSDVTVDCPLRLVFLDCGITVSLEEADREKFVQVFTAVVKGEGEQVADLFLEKSKHVDCADPDAFRKDMADIVNSARKTALQLSKCQHDPEVLTAILQLQQAISQERPHMQNIEKMLENLPVSVDHMCYKFVMSPMELACTTGNLGLVRLLLHHGADVHGRQRNAHSLYWQPLHLACGEGENNNVLQIVQLLLQHGADINAYNGDGEQPLHLACNSNNLDVVRFLLSHGADVNCSGPHWYGKTPLLLACSAPDCDISPDIVRVLVEHGADVHAVTANGLDCLTNACVELSVSKVMMLLACGARVKSSGPGVFRTVFEKVNPDEDQFSALFTIIKLLLAAGATLDRRFVLKFVLQSNPALHIVKDEILEFLGKQLVEPVSLKSLCRIVVRDCLSQNINAGVEYLGLPSIVMDYLKFEDIVYGSICS